MTGGAAVADRGVDHAATASAARPVMLLTCNVAFDPTAVRVAVDAAAESDAELYICDAIPIGYFTYVDQMARRFAEHDNRRELDGVARDARTRGVRTTQLAFHNPRPVATALEVCREERVGLLVFGPDRSRFGRVSHRRAVRRLRRDAQCLLWLPD
jgi:nucleotide-binding universal stress UspA family protein